MEFTNVKKIPISSICWTNLSVKISRNRCEKCKFWGRKFVKRKIFFVSLQSLALTIGGRYEKFIGQENTRVIN